MTNNLKNKAQVEKYLNGILFEVLEKLSVEMRKKLQEKIKRDTYEYEYAPNFIYENGDGTFGSGQPSFEFEEAFRWKDTKISGSEITKKLFYSWATMTIDRDTGRHFENGKDTRKMLAEMLNVAGEVGHKERLPYWDNFVKEMNVQFMKMFEKEATLKGLKLIHRGTFSNNYDAEVEKMADILNKFVQSSFTKMSR